MKKLKTALYASLTALFAVALVLIAYNSPINKAYGDITANLGLGIPTNSGINCIKGTSTLVQATTTNRSYIRISNASGFGMYLSVGIPAATSSGIYLSASSSIDFAQGNILPLGNIYCLADAGNATATVFSYP